jgi:hypothetical protein
MFSAERKKEEEEEMRKGKREVLVLALMLSTNPLTEINNDKLTILKRQICR